jgi:hypothetical protein
MVPVKREQIEFYLVLCPGNTFTESLDFFQDGIGRGRPGEGSGLRIVATDERFDFGNKFFDAAEGAPTDGLLRDDVEPDFHLVEPGRVGGREVHVVTGACCQPALDARMLVGSIVIDNQVHVKGLGHAGVDMPQKIEELLVTMTAFALTQDRSGDRVEGRKQCGGAVSDVVVRDAFDVAQSQGQHRLATLQRLNLALLVHAQDQGLIRWVQIQPDYVTYLLDEERVIGKLEVTRSVRLQAEGAPDPEDAEGENSRARIILVT